MVTVLADQHKVRLFGLARSEEVGDAERFRPRRCDRRRLGVSRICSRSPSTATSGETPLGARRGHQSGRVSPAARADSTSSAPSTARTFVNDNPPDRDAVGRTTARTSTPRPRSPASRRRRPTHLDGLDEQLALCERGADRDLARRAVGPAPAGSPAPARGRPSRAGADR